MPDEPRFALITGGTRGIGLGIAVKLAEARFTVAATGRRPAEADNFPLQPARVLVLDGGLTMARL